MSPRPPPTRGPHAALALAVRSAGLIFLIQCVVLAVTADLGAVAGVASGLLAAMTVVLHALTAGPRATEAAVPHWFLLALGWCGMACAAASWPVSFFLDQPAWGKGLAGFGGFALAAGPIVLWFMALARRAVELSDERW